MDSQHGRLKSTQSIHTHTPTNHTYTGNTGLPLVNVQACTHFFILLIKPDIVEAFSHSSVGETPRLTGGS